MSGDPGFLSREIGPARLLGAQAGMGEGRLVLFGTGENTGTALLKETDISRQGFRVG